MDYPHRVIRMGERDARIVRTLKKKLNDLLALDGESRLDPDNPEFGPRMRQTVRLFQARHVDPDGRSLKQDGEVGPVTWAALFGVDSVKPGSRSAPALLARAVEIAGRAAEKEVRETPRNSNRGPEVDEYMRRAGAPLGHAWCCAFIYWCMDEAAKELNQSNPMARTAGCLEHWRCAQKSGAICIERKRVLEDVSLIAPGSIFIMDHGGGLGHTGFVEDMQGGLMRTIEGNTDASRTREGGGVYRLTRRIGEVNKGVIYYGAVVH